MTALLIVTVPLAVVLLVDTVRREVAWRSAPRPRDIRRK